jgi:hypothetical protein
MRCGGMFLLLIAFILPTYAGEDKKGDVKKKDGDNKKTDVKKKEGDDKKGDEPKVEKLVYGRVFNGKLTQIDPKDQSEFTVQVTYKVTEPNRDAHIRLGQLQVQLAQQQARLKTVRNAQEQQQVLREISTTQGQIVQTQRDLYRSKDVTQDFKLKAAQTMHVRLPAPPPEYDDKGDLIKFSAKELKERKGPLNLPGYTGTRGDLKPNQLVTVYLAKDAAPAKTVSPKGKKIDDLADLALTRPEVVMILIVREPQPK